MDENKLEIHAGEMEGSYEYFQEWKRKHPTCENIGSDYFAEDDL